MSEYLKGTSDLHPAYSGHGPSPRDRSDPPDPQATRPDDRPPKGDPVSIGPYRVLQRVGEGGMGVVYRCEQREPVRRTVAVKIIKVGMDTREVVARFNAERQALSLMNHPNVARALDAGVTESGRPYFAMEYVPGVPITRYCDAHRLTTAERLELFVPVCLAVQHAHQKGIIHRDLKPSNILVTLIDGQPVPKVIDFGIAKAANIALTQQTLFTQIGAMIGTPEYMSPEQAQTSGIDVDTRTDVYSLGVILYELLTGALPFDPVQFREMGVDGIARVIREAEPRRPSTRLAHLSAAPPAAVADAAGEPSTTPATPADRRRTDARTLIRELRGDLDWIIMKAMDKDRARRYETANGLAVDVRRYLAHEPVSARPPTAWYRLRKLARRRRGMVAAGLAVALSLVIGIVATGLATVRAREAEHVAVQKNDELARALGAADKANAVARREAEKAGIVTRFLQDVLAPPERDGDEQARDARVVDILARAEQDVARRFKDQPDVQLQTRHTLFRTYANLGLAEPAARQLDEAWAILQQHPDLRPSEMGLRAAADYAYYFRGGPADREQLAAATARLAAEHLGEGSEPALLAAHVRARAIDAQGRAEEAAVIYQQLVDRLRKAGPGAVEDANAAAPFSALGVRLRDNGRYPQAVDLFREGLTYATAARYNRLRMRWIFSSNLAAALERQDQLPEAADIHRGIIADVRQKLGNDHPSIGPSLENYVAVLRRLDRGDEIARVEREQREIFRQASDQPAPTPMLLARRAHARVCAGRLADAVEDYEELIALEPAEHKHRYFLACVLAHLDDRPAYDRVRGRMLRDFAQTDDHVARMRLAKAAMLLPPTAEHCRAAADMLRRADASRKDRWYRLAKATVDYRDGQHASTLELCRGLEADGFQNAGADATVQFLLALAHHARGETAPAAESLARGNDLVARKVPALETGRIYAVGIEDWLICNVIGREAKAALGAN